MSDRPNESESDNELSELDAFLHRAYERLLENTNLNESELLNLTPEDFYTLFRESVAQEYAETYIQPTWDQWRRDGYNEDWMTLNSAIAYWDENGDFSDPLQTRIFGSLLGNALNELGWEDMGNGYLEPYGGFQLNGWTQDVSTGRWISPEGKTVHQTGLDYYLEYTFDGESWDQEEHRVTTPSNPGGGELKY